MTLPVTNKIPYGGDYNPEQWPHDVWAQDHKLFDLARVDTVTVGVFTWALTQPAPDVYDFTTLDAIVERAAAEGRAVCLATGTGAHPAWLARAHPEVTRVDFEGRRHRFGQRHNSCPSSPVFRRLSAELARRIAARYAANPAVVAWHVGNEYGGACADPRPDTRAQGRAAVLADGADPELHRLPGRQPAETARDQPAVELAGCRARRGRGAVLPATGLAGREREVPRRGHRARGPGRHPGVR
jgi:beta-galactosidase GanA